MCRDNRQYPVFNTIQARLAFLLLRELTFKETTPSSEPLKLWFIRDHASRVLEDEMGWGCTGDRGYIIYFIFF